MVTMRFERSSSRPPKAKSGRKLGSSGRVSWSDLTLRVSEVRGGRLYLNVLHASSNLDIVGHSFGILFHSAHLDMHALDIRENVPALLQVNSRDPIALHRLAEVGQFSWCILQ